MRLLRLCVAGMLVVCRPGAVPAILPWEAWNDPSALARVGGGYGSYLTSSYCLDGCRYDRTSVDPGRRGQRFVRIESTPRKASRGVIFQAARRRCRDPHLDDDRRRHEPAAAFGRAHPRLRRRRVDTGDREPLDHFFRDHSDAAMSRRWRRTVSSPAAAACPTGRWRTGTVSASRC